MQILRNRYRLPYLSLALLLLFQQFTAVPAYALTSGPAQPEYTQMQTVSADNLVDPFTGNFRYSIPLFEIGGYPMTLNYSSDHKMEEEASWVGFGWSLSPGAISRQVRGVPDDFDGDAITRTTSMADNVTTGIKPGASVEIGGYHGLSAGLNFTYNNYTGFEFSQDLSPALNIAAVFDPSAGQVAQNSSGEENNTGNNPPVASPFQVSKSKDQSMTFKELDFNFNISSTVNSRTGMQAVGFRTSDFFSPIGNRNLLGGSGVIQLGGFTYTPTGDIPRQIFSSTFTTKLGFKPNAIVAFKTIEFEGYLAQQRVIGTPVTRSAYGYLHLDGAAADPRAIMDYNSERGGILAQHTPRLPMSYGTPDVFMVSGAGIGGQIRVARNDVGIFRPPVTRINSVDTGFDGFEFSAADGVHPGLNISVAATTKEAGIWEDQNPFFNSLNFGINENERESAFMMMEGEPIAQLGGQWHEDIGTFHPIYTPVKGANLVNGVSLRGEFRTENAADLDFSSIELPFVDWGSRSRRPRAQMVSFLTNEEAAVAGVTKQIISYRPLDRIISNTFSDSPANLRVGYSTERVDRAGDLDNNNNYRQPHHISEVRITNTGGQRYIYGLPAYNTLKKEVTFNISGRIADAIANDETSQEAISNSQGTYGLVTYDPNQDATINNDNGRDHFYDEVVTAPYPYAHLLTEVLSPDYADRTGDGPSFDDLGQYVKIGYTKGDTYGAGRGPGLVGWRVPLGRNLATYNPGNLSDKEDDKASYTYGEKEVWYVHHMDSKTHRAVFFTNPRDDSYSIEETGELSPFNIDHANYRMLEEIRIYTHAELGANGPNAVPLKTIRFEYAPAATSISPNIPTNNLGESTPKLTLASVSITYADNDRGADNPYVFTYNLGPDGTQLPYQAGMVDRWGNQRPAQLDYPGPQLFPYTIQDNDLAQDYCAIGNLEEIGLPSGGTINVKYEPDDYAYVQDKRAGRMFRLLGMIDEGDPNAEDLTQELYSLTHPSNRANLQLVVEVEELPLNDQGEIDQEKVKRLYLEDVEQLYFSARVGLQADNGSQEQLSGYINFDPLDVIGRQADGDTDHLIIPIDGVNSNNRSTGFNRFHPITFAGLEKIRLELPALVYDISDNDSDFVGFLHGMLRVLQEIGPSLRGFHGIRVRQGMARVIDSTASFIRLAEPNFAKLGDGSRVSEISLNDNWLEGLNPTTGYATTYTQVYSYKTVDPVTDELISSGVAANEPQIGREESLLVNVETGTQRIPLAPNKTYYVEGPIGETFYPGGQVGYSRVTMQQRIPSSFDQSKPGISVYEYYTAKDFPVLASVTEVSDKRRRALPNLTPFASIARSQLGLSQGYAIEVNDMHGKMKRTQELANNGDVISESFYRYREQRSPAPMEARQLNSQVPTASADNELIEDQLLAVDQEVWIEMREEFNRTRGGGAAVNLDFGTPLIFWPSGFPAVRFAENILRSSVTTKLSRRYGILEEVEVTNNGSKLSTQNLVWDALTGAVLRNSTENEFGQPIFSQSLPAYYMQEHYGMRPAYENEGAEFENVIIENGTILSNSPGEDQLFHGDELLIRRALPGYSPEFERAYVFAPEGEVYVVRQDGSLLNPAGADVPDARFYDLTVIRSGQRNVLGAVAGQTASLSVVDNQIFWPSTTTDGIILSSGATTYSDGWSNQCKNPPPAPEIDYTEPPLSCQAIYDSTRNDLNGRICQGNQIFDLLAVRDAIIECDKCEDLFLMLTGNGCGAGHRVLSTINTYAICQFGGITIRPEQQAAVDNCEFLDDVAWLSGGGPAPLCGNYRCSNCNSVADEGSARPASQASSMANDPCFPWEPGDIINPFLDGRRGNWRAAESYIAQQQDRNYSQEGAPPPASFENDFTQPLIYRDGTFDDYLPFWTYNSFNQQVVRLNNGDSHLLTERIRAYDDQGHQLESTDALDIPSAAQYGYQHDLMVGVAQNARRTDIGIENFEDYAYGKLDLADEDRLPRHFAIRDNIENGLFYGLISNQFAHTGRQSLRMRSVGFSGTVNRAEFSYPVLDCGIASSCSDGNGCPCSNSFSPLAGKRYHFSVWVARDESICSGENAGSPGYDQVSNNFSHTFHLRVAQTGSNGQTVSNWQYFYPSGPIVDGWQQMSGIIEIAANAQDVQFELRTPQVPTVTTFFYADDFRIQPEESVLTSYVYDPSTMRLSAQLDENNYATFYEYDDEGRLVRLKRETDRGVMTVSEQQTNLAPTQNP
ncbi:MAG: hypothetical protein AAF433_06060 [Bacteroidota bacterium]